MHRRALDILSDEDKIEIRGAAIQVIHDDLQSVKMLLEQQKASIEKVQDILEAWDNAKGFIATIKMVGEVAKWVAAVAVAAGAIWYWLKR